MKKSLTYVSLFFLCFNAISQELPIENVSFSPYANIRESKSSLISNDEEDEISRAYVGTKSGTVLKGVIADSKINTCATKVISAIERQLNLSEDSEVKRAILGLRYLDLIDDVAAGILVRANKLSRSPILPFAKNDLSDEEEEKALEVFREKAKEFKDKAYCIEDTYRSLVVKLVGKSPKYGKNLKHINRLALEHNVINNEDHKLVEKMRLGKVHEWPMTLSSYAQDLDSISKKFPNRVKQSSPLVTDITEGKFRNKKSLRQSLYEKYSSTQIILLGNMVRDLKSRLEAKDITININYEDRPTEVIDLSPMERFRFILKLLRKELSTINNGSLLNGNRASYIDIITASYEVGYISDTEIEQLASLEEIWNPKKTTKERVIAWGKKFGGMASILLPGPYGFVSVLTIMIIDQYVSQSPVVQDPDYDIF